MKTQLEQIKNAKRAYLLLLNNPKDGASASRYAVYLDAGNGLEALWPIAEEDKKNLLPYQSYSSLETYPAYHFIMKGCGYSKSGEIGATLKHINPAIETYTLAGHSPSIC